MPPRPLVSARVNMHAQLACTVVTLTVEHAELSVLLGYLTPNPWLLLLAHKTE